MANDIEHLQKQLSEIDTNLKLIDERISEYAIPTAVPIDLIKSQRSLQKRQAELRQRLQELTAPPAPGATRLSSPADVKKIHVDRDEEKELFRKMIHRETTIHILLLEAEGGMGKTILLDQFWAISEGLKRTRIDFKNAGYSLGQILGDMCDQYGAQSFPTFHTECRNYLSRFGGATVNPALLCSKIDAQLTQEKSMEDRRLTQQVITAAFLADLDTIYSATTQPMVMFFDTFEKASDPTKAWIGEQLIMQIRRYPWLVCVVGGRETPRITTDGGDWCLQHKLQPLSDKHSIEYIQRVRYTQNEELITFITKRAKGSPYELQQLVMTLLEV